MITGILTHITCDSLSETTTFDLHSLLGLMDDICCAVVLIYRTQLVTMTWKVKIRVLFRGRGPITSLGF